MDGSPVTVTMTGTQTTPEGGHEGLPAELGRASHIWAVLRRDRTAMLGVILVAALVVAALLAPVIAPHDPNAVDVAKKYRGPSGEFLLARTTWAATSSPGC